MTRAGLEAMVRREFEQLGAEDQERAALRALNRAVFAWSHMTVEQLKRLYGSARAVALLTEAAEG